MLELVLDFIATCCWINYCLEFGVGFFIAWNLLLEYSSSGICGRLSLESFLGEINFWNLLLDIYRLEGIVETVTAWNLLKYSPSGIDSWIYHPLEFIVGFFIAWNLLLEYSSSEIYFRISLEIFLGEINFWNFLSHCLASRSYCWNSHRLEVIVQTFIFWNWYFDISSIGIRCWIFNRLEFIVGMLCSNIHLLEFIVGFLSKLLLDRSSLGRLERSYSGIYCGLVHRLEFFVEIFTVWNLFWQIHRLEFILGIFCKLLMNKSLSGICCWILHSLEFIIGSSSPWIFILRHLFLNFRGNCSWRDYRLEFIIGLHSSMARYSAGKTVQSPPKLMLISRAWSC